MGLFDKKTCCICGGKIGLLGNKKLSDGDMCKDCAKLLSPWFQDRKESTVADIKAQLQDRENNKELLKDFKTRYAFGEFGCILIDRDNKQFVAMSDTSDGLFASAKTVTDISQIIDKNPDIIKFSQIENVDVKTKVTSREEKKTENNQQVSYDPKHFTYMVAFELEITVKDHPYIRYIYVPLNNGSIQIYTEEPRLESDLGHKLAAKLFDLPNLDVQNCAECYDNTSFTDWFLRNPYELPAYSYGFKCSQRNKADILKYHYYLLLSRCIAEMLDAYSE